MTDSYELYGYDGLVFEDEEAENATCLEQCRENGILCPIDCPCHENCPNGCPCGYVSADCDFHPEEMFPMDPDLIWCFDSDPTGAPEDKACENLWEEEIAECAGYCDFIQEGCKDRCEIEHDDEGDRENCDGACEKQHACCMEDCPCNDNCPHGCPCTAVECPGGTCVCPELPSNSTCMEKWGQYAKRCDFDCLDAGYDCIYNNCTMEDMEEEERHECYRMCKDNEIECIMDCPCYRDCPNGCDIGPCPTVSFGSPEKLNSLYFSGINTAQ